jgi:hypothetical protein
MQTRSSHTHWLAPLLFLLGLLWLSVLAFLLSWPDMEASVFDTGTSLVADERLRALRCPYVITADEEAMVRVRFENEADRKASFLVRSRISRGYLTLVDEDTQQLNLAPGQAQSLEWPVSARDAVYGRVVMARVLAMRSAAGPARERACGILVLGPAGIPGRWILALSLLLGLALCGGGALWWWRQRRPLGFHARGTARRAGLLSFVVLASLVAGLLSLWLVSHLLLISAAGLALALLQQSLGGTF